VTEFGYTMMCEQSRADQLVRDIQAAEAAGFDFSVISDHYQPWLSSQGHSPYAWSVLGAAAQATERIPLMTYVTCPTIRYHPRGRRAEGGDRADPVREPLPSGARRG
jgi:G6PDH family F420-dependent oxidoreductase